MISNQRARCVALFLFAATVVTGPAADAATNLTFVPEAPEVRCDEEVWVDIVTDDVAVDLRGHSLSFYTDPARLEVVDFAAGTLFDDAGCNTFVRGVVIGLGVAQVDIAGLGCSVDGPGSIARVLVRGRADGPSPLRGIESILRTSANAAIDATWTDGVLMVLCPIPNDGSSWSTVKSRFR